MRKAIVTSFLAAATTATFRFFGDRNETSEGVAMAFRVPILAILAGLLVYSHADARTWTSDNGKHIVEADLVGVEDGKVLLRKASGDVVRVPLERLGASDQAYVKKATNKAATSTQPTGGDWQSSSKASEAASSTCQLALQRWTMEPGSDTLFSHYYRYLTSMQEFSLYSAPSKNEEVQSARRAEQEAAFKRIVREQPHLKSDRPFRGVARFGSQEHAFVFDCVPRAIHSDSSKPAPHGPSIPAYNRLFFDANHNGDLTDDPVIDAEPPPPGVSDGRFPPVEVTVDVEGTNSPYTVRVNLGRGERQGISAMWVYFGPGAYREGTMKLNGTPMHVVLLDSNSNGRFGDTCTLPEVTGPVKQVVYPVVGDMLVIEPEANRRDVRLGSEVSPSNQYYVSKLLQMKDRFYEVEISPTGDRLTLTPYRPPMGAISSAEFEFKAVLFGDLGMVSIAGGPSRPAPVPAGNWRLMSYTLRRDESASTKPTSKAKKSPKTSAATSKSSSRSTIVSANSQDCLNIQYSELSARGTDRCRPIEVRQGETVPLPFGSSYRLVVEGKNLRAGQEAQLDVSLVGSNGEVCIGLHVRGEPPTKSKLTIRDSQGKTLESGKLKFG